MAFYPCFPATFGGNLINKVVITIIKQRLSVQATYTLFKCFCCNSYSDNKLDSWRLSPCIIVLFCLFTLVTVIFSIRLRVAIENRRVYT